ncbi:MAG: Clp protease ClpP [Oscillospiraceae bacterium]|nr:Clp protease ClpP [Oscillospiraceae bacterium]
MDININGLIVPTEDKWIYSFFGYQTVCPADVEKALQSAKPDEQVDVWINSPGGSVYDGSEIYTRLKAYKGTVKIHITGIAASAASVIACASWCEIAPTAQIMIHDAACESGGNKLDHTAMADLLDKTDKTIANAYRLKTGRTEAEILEKMDNTTYFTPQEAVDFGLADAIMFDNENKLNDRLQLTASSISLLPEAVISKMRTERNSKNTNGDFDKLKAQAKLNLIKRGGKINGS